MLVIFLLWTNYIYTKDRTQMSFASRAKVLYNSKIALKLHDNFFATQFLVLLLAKFNWISNLFFQTAWGNWPRVINLFY